MQLERVVLDASTLTRSPTLPYVRMVTWLLERVSLSLDELVALMLEIVRQRSIAKRSRNDYVLDFLHQHPP